MLSKPAGLHPPQGPISGVPRPGSQIVATDRCAVHVDDRLMSWLGVAGGPPGVSTHSEAHPGHRPMGAPSRSSPVLTVPQESWQGLATRRRVMGSLVVLSPATPPKRSFGSVFEQGRSGPAKKLPIRLGSIVAAVTPWPT